MSITSLPFLYFVLASVLLVRLAGRWGGVAARGWVMLGCNLFFAASFVNGAWLLLLPMAGFALMGLAITHWLKRNTAPKAFGLAVLLVLAVFVWLKKYSFVPEALWIQHPYLTLGLSYILFRVLQVMIDTREGHLTDGIGLRDYGNYLTSYPTFMSGPIQRVQDWQEQQREPLPLGWAMLGDAAERMVLGLFKVAVVAPIVLGWHKGALKGLDDATTLTSLGSTGALVAGGYAVYLYLNFSGYTDIVVGVGRLLGLTLPENFNRPFAAGSFLDFWARWHMSLSDWLKTYVYNPVVVALMRRYPSRKLEPYIGVAAFFVTFFLIGLWHGQTMVFALYGFLLGLGVSVNKLYQIALTKRLGRKPYNELARRPLYQAWGRGLTFAWFSLSLVCFWAGWDQIVGLCSRLGGLGIAATAVALMAFASTVFTAWELLRQGLLRPVRASDGQPWLRHRYARTVWVTAMVAIAVTSLALTSGPAPDIVYKNF